MKDKIFKIAAVVGLVVGLVALVAVFSGPKTPENAGQSQSLAGTYNISNANPTFLAGADFGNFPVNVNWYGEKLIPTDNLGVFQNNTGSPIWVDYAEFSTDGTASSSYKVYAYATTTAPRALFDFVTPVNQSGVSSTTLLINGWNMATSSTATTTTSDDSRTGSGGLVGSSALVPRGGYFIVQLIAANGVICNTSSGGVCETATSTRRGFNANVRLHYHN